MFTKDYKEKEDDFIYLKINKKDFCDFMSYNSFIETHLEQGNRIPLRVFEKFISFIKLKDTDKENYYKEEADNVTKEVISYFKKDSRYYFLETTIEVDAGDDIPRLKHIDTSNDKNIVKVSFEEMIEEAVATVFGNILERKIKKDECIRIGYDSLNTYKIDKLDGKVEHKLTSDNNYKLEVIAGYIAIRCGYRVAKSKPLTTYILNYPLSMYLSLLITCLY